MEWASIVNNCRDVFLYAYAVFVVYALLRWILASGKSKYSLRDWLGSLGLAAGSCSALLFAGFFVYWRTEHKLIANGLAQGFYFLAGGCLAIGGLILGSTGRGWIRLSAVFVALVMIFQWWGELIFQIGNRGVVTIAMFITLAVIESIVLGRRWFVRRANQT